ncbi:MAG TPA: hypothetical protein VKN36_18930 [Eudoraea sp.]|nr:hypothetical protein [Eudoraea sp.]
MDVINEIIRQSAIGSMSKLYKNLVLIVFSSIVFILLSMIIFMIKNAATLTFSYGY